MQKDPQHPSQTEASCPHCVQVALEKVRPSVSPGDLKSHEVRCNAVPAAARRTSVPARNSPRCSEWRADCKLTPFLVSLLTAYATSTFQQATLGFELSQVVGQAWRSLQVQVADNPYRLLDSF